MSERVAAAIAVIVYAGCGDSSDRRASTVVLRVSATHGLTPVLAGPPFDGSTAYAMDLVFQSWDQHVRIDGRDGATVHMSRLPKSPFTAGQLGDALRFEGLSKVSVDDQRIDAVFATAEAAAYLHRLAQLRRGRLKLFELGPYRVGSRRHDRVFLDRRTPGGGADVIEIVASDATREWRDLFAHNVDVIASAPELHRQQFDGINSVRRIDIPVTTLMTMAVNPHDGALRSQDVRSRLLSLLDTPAISRVACGSRNCWVEPWYRPTVKSIAPLPEQLSILVLETDSPALAASRVVKHQLRRDGVSVEINAVSLQALRNRHQAGQYQLMLIPTPSVLDPAAVKIIELLQPANETKRSALELLREQALAVPLYKMRFFAAVDARFCGGNPRSFSSWAWLAELELCRDRAQ